MVFIVGASLASTPLFFAVFERFIAPKLMPATTRAFDKIGFGNRVFYVDASSCWKPPAPRRPGSSWWPWTT